MEAKAQRWSLTEHVHSHTVLKPRGPQIYICAEFWPTSLHCQEFLYSFLPSTLLFTVPSTFLLSFTCCFISVQCFSSFFFCLCSLIYKSSALYYTHRHVYSSLFDPFILLPIISGNGKSITFHAFLLFYTMHSFFIIFLYYVLLHHSRFCPVLF